MNLSNRNEQNSTLSSSVTVRASRIFKSTPEIAFRAWSQPENIKQWFGPPGFRAEILTHELEEGGRWRYLMVGGAGQRVHHFGEFITIDPPHRLVFTWASEEQVDGWRDTKGKPTRVTVSFDPCIGGVKVTIIHEKLTSKIAQDALTNGWKASLVSLSDFLKSRR